jgi:hypothetical protein
MAARLAKVEAQNQQLGQQVAAQNLELKKLRKDKAARQQVTKSVQDGSATQLLQERTEEAAELKEQITSMKQLLEQYGLTWEAKPRTKPTRWKVGGHVLGTEEGGSVAYYQPDVDALLQRIAQINQTVNNSDNPAVLPSGQGVHSMLDNRKAHEKAKLKFTIFADGIMVRRGPFRPYTEVKTRAMVEDLLDGWLPSEWQDAFPNGVAIDTADRRGEQYNIGQNALVEGGQKNVMNMDELRAGPKSEAPLGRDEFLKRLPGTKVKDGCVVNIRADIAALFDSNGGEKGSSSSGGSDGNGQASRQAMARAAEQRAAAKQAAERRAAADTKDSVSNGHEEKHSGGNSRGGSNGGNSRESRFSFESCAGDTKEEHNDPPPPDFDVPTAVLQVRLPDGQPSIQLRLGYSVTVGEVIRLIAERAPDLETSVFSTTNGGSTKPKYELRTAYPNRAYTDAEQTLEEAGLVPNAALVLRKLPV